MYWEEDYPNGVADVNVVNLLDLDEMGLFLKSTNRKFGKMLRRL